MPNTLEFLKKILNKLENIENFTTDEEKLRLLELQRKLQDINSRINDEKIQQSTSSTTKTTDKRVQLLELQRKLDDMNINVNDEKIQKPLSKTDKKEEKKVETEAIGEKIKWVFIAFGIFFAVLFLAILGYWIYSIMSSSKTETSSVKNSYTEELLKNKFTEGEILKVENPASVSPEIIPPAVTADVVKPAVSVPKTVSQSTSGDNIPSASIINTDFISNTFKTPLYNTPIEETTTSKNMYDTSSPEKTMTSKSPIYDTSPEQITTSKNIYDDTLANNIYDDIDKDYKTADKTDNNFDTFNYTNNSKKLLGGKKKK